MNLAMRDGAKDIIAPRGSPGEISTVVFFDFVAAEFAPDHSVGVKNSRLAAVFMEVRRRFNSTHFHISRGATSGAGGVATDVSY